MTAMTAMTDAPHVVMPIAASVTLRGLVTRAVAVLVAIPPLRVYLTLRARMTLPELPGFSLGHFRFAKSGTPLQTRLFGLVAHRDWPAGHLPGRPCRLAFTYRTTYPL
jgi:hypothetical protein